MKKIIYLVWILLFVSGITFSQTKASHANKKGLACNTCHMCEVPTTEKPCLVPCPREKMTNAAFKLEDAPDEITIDDLENMYGPVQFPHKLHAEMAQMSGGCVTCHHYNTTSLEILSCSDCHSEKRKRSDISKPDLKGAYHQLCLSCHREWSHKTECVSCHTPKTKGKNVKLTKKVFPKEHPKVVKPDKIIFKTMNEDGPIVTFHHKSHNELYGFNNCSTCHQNETCVACHDVQKKDIVTSSNGEKVKTIIQKKENDHALCKKCHDTEDVDNCSTCHKDKVAKPFNHKEATGWALNKFHKKLKCIACHGLKKQFTKLDKSCNSCHSNWNQDNFNHSITGLKLDDTHKDFYCVNCHPNREFDKKPVCSECHDDKSFPKQVPGKFVKLK